MKEINQSAQVWGGSYARLGKEIAKCGVYFTAQIRQSYGARRLPAQHIESCGDAQLIFDRIMMDEGYSPNTFTGISRLALKHAMARLRGVCKGDVDMLTFGNLGITLDTFSGLRLSAKDPGDQAYVNNALRQPILSLHYLAYDHRGLAGLPDNIKSAATFFTNHPEFNADTTNVMMMSHDRLIRIVNEFFCRGAGIACEVDISTIPSQIYGGIQAKCRAADMARGIRADNADTAPISAIILPLSTALHLAESLSRQEESTKSPIVGN